MGQGVNDVGHVVLLDHVVLTALPPTPIQDDSRVHDRGYEWARVSMTWATVVLLDHVVLTGLPPPPFRMTAGSMTWVWVRVSMTWATVALLNHVVLTGLPPLPFRMTAGGP
jgi:hypothetical protein